MVRVISSLRWPLTFVLLGTLALGAYVWTLRSTGMFVKGVNQTVKDIGEQIGSVAERFRTGRITNTFVAAIPQLSSTGSGNLELATAEVTETVGRSDELRLFWDSISLGQTVTEIRVPVTYRFHLRLSDPWRLEVSGQTCIVNAPPIRPSLPPAIHTDRMEKRSARGWLRFNVDEQMADLERSLTPTLAAYSTDKRHLALVRESCRKTVGEFVRTWLLKEDHWRSDRFYSIIVMFGDEDRSPSEFLRPTIVLAP